MCQCVARQPKTSVDSVVPDVPSTPERHQQRRASQSQRMTITRLSCYFDSLSVRLSLCHLSHNVWLSLACHATLTLCLSLCPQHHWKMSPEAYCIQMCLFVSECVNLCIPKTLRTPCLKNQWREFHRILVADVRGFIDVLIRFWGQKVKGQGHSQQWPENLVNTISQQVAQLS